MSLAYTRVGGGGGSDTENVLPNRIMKAELQEKNCSLHLHTYKIPLWEKIKVGNTPHTPVKTQQLYPDITRGEGRGGFIYYCLGGYSPK